MKQQRTPRFHTMNSYSQSDIPLVPFTLSKPSNLSLSTIIGLVLGALILNVAWKTYIHSQRDRGTVPRAPHLIPWVGNLRALLLEPVAWPWAMHEKLVSSKFT
jgi:hypothetical protein